jgi:hypothetical protein
MRLQAEAELQPSQDEQAEPFPFRRFITISARTTAPASAIPMIIVAISRPPD